MFEDLPTYSIDDLALKIHAHVHCNVSLPRVFFYRLEQNIIETFYIINHCECEISLNLFSLKITYSNHTTDELNVITTYKNQDSFFNAIVLMLKDN